MAPVAVLAVWILCATVAWLVIITVLTSEWFGLSVRRWWDRRGPRN